MKRINTFVLALVLLSSLTPTVTVAQQAPATMPYHTVWGRRGAAPGDTGPGQAIPFATLALDLAQSGIGSVYAVTPVSVPAGGMTLLASPIGTGNCITAACNLPTACAFASQLSTFVGRPSIQLADGTYTTGETQPANTGPQCHMLGDNGGSSAKTLFVISGNAITPTNVVISIQNGQSGFFCEDGAIISISNLEMKNVNGGGSGISARQDCIVDYSGIYWGAWGNSGNHVAAFGNAVTVNPNGETLLANTTFLTHWLVSNGAILSAGGTTTIQSSVTWSTVFAEVFSGGFNLDITGWTLSGTGTGPQFIGSGVGILNTNAACASSFPGSGGCTFLGGFQSSHTADTNQGNGALIQHSTGAITTNNCAKFDANGNTVDEGSPCNPGSWTSFTPTITCGSGAIGSYSRQNGLYALIGTATVVFQMDVQAAIGTCSGAIVVNLPQTSNSGMRQNISGTDTTTSTPISASVAANSSSATLVNVGGSNPTGSDNFVIGGTYSK